MKKSVLFVAYVDKLEDTKKVPVLSKMKLLPDINKHGSVTDLLEKDMTLMVQIANSPPQK